MDFLLLGFLEAHSHVVSSALYDVELQIIQHTYDYFHSYTNPIWISWDQYTGVEEQNNELIVFPNPSTNQLVIKTDNPSEFLTYSLYNNLGQLITEKEIKNNFEFIDISYLSKGFYNLVIYKENNAPIVKKIIKQ